MARNKRKNRIANTLAVCFWLCAWQAASVCIGQKLILVSPLEVCGALLALLPTADFWQTAAFSAGRIIGGFLLALALGLALAALAAALPYFRSACTVGLGLCWKSGVAAEVIGITSGSIGEALYNAKILFSTAELLAWTVVIVLLSLAFERLFLWGLARVESVLLERSGT